MTVSTSTVARSLGISRQRVNELARKGRITRETDGRWDLSKVLGCVRPEGKEDARAKTLADSYSIGQRISQLDQCGAALALASLLQGFARGLKPGEAVQIPRPEEGDPK